VLQNLLQGKELISGTHWHTTIQTTYPTSQMVT